MLAAELSAKLEADICLGFSGRFAADLAGRARAFQSMVGAGMDLGHGCRIGRIDGSGGLNITASSTALILDRSTAKCHNIVVH